MNYKLTLQNDVSISWFQPWVNRVKKTKVHSIRRWKKGWKSVAG